MAVFGLPPATFAMMIATIAAGSLGAFHYVVIHIFLGKSFSDEEAGE